jgi:hypothetical protein
MTISGATGIGIAVGLAFQWGQAAVRAIRRDDPDTPENEAAGYGQRVVNYANMGSGFGNNAPSKYDALGSILTSGLIVGGGLVIDRAYNYIKGSQPWSGTAKGNWVRDRVLAAEKEGLAGALNPGIRMGGGGSGGGMGMKDFLALQVFSQLTSTTLIPQVTRSVEEALAS